MWIIYIIKYLQWIRKNLIINNTNYLLKRPSYTLGLLLSFTSFFVHLLFNYSSEITTSLFNRLFSTIPIPIYFLFSPYILYNPSSTLKVNLTPFKNNSSFLLFNIITFKSLNTSSVFSKYLFLNSSLSLFSSNSSKVTDWSISNLSTLILLKFDKYPTVPNFLAISSDNVLIYVPFDTSTSYSKELSSLSILSNLIFFINIVLSRTSTSFPSLAYSYNFLQFTFFAEYI